MVGFGTLNGDIDSLLQTPYIPVFANNNTYGIQAVSPELAELMTKNFTMPGGGRDLIKNCRQEQAEKDPHQWGNNTEVNNACSEAAVVNFLYIQKSFDVSGRSAFDINIQMPGDDVPHYPSGFYNQRWVQQALGSPVNFTLNSDSVPQAFGLTGDFEARSMDDLNTLAAAGVHLTFVYGDLDHRCNCESNSHATLRLSLTISQGSVLRISLSH